ncbi:MAG: glycosyltransferase family 2 protein, partial [Candidatus Omnitrophota bacterium]
MRSPTLQELPPPPEGKTGWPWTAKSPQLPETMPDGSPWPRISIVTPSYNQGKFIEETIRSVLLQGYPDLEYIIIDGGSSDESVAIIKKYAPWLSYWISESDNGQAHAINKGFSRATGTTIGWLNSDDTYLSGVFRAIAEYFSVHHDRQVVFGDCHAVDECGNVISVWKGHFSNRRDLIRWWKRERVTGPIWILQPSVFFSRDARARTGFLDESLYYVLDYEFWIRLSGVYKFFYIEHTLSTYRLHSTSKSVTRDEEKQLAECERVSKRNWGR